MEYRLMVLLGNTMDNGKTPCGFHGGFPLAMISPCMVFHGNHMASCGKTGTVLRMLLVGNDYSYYLNVPE